MADKNDLNEPKVDSNYLDVLDSLRGHISRLWKGDYTGMTNLVAGIRRWVILSNSNIKLVSRNADGTELTLFDSTSKADVSALSAKANAADVSAALANKADVSALSAKANAADVNAALATKATIQQVEAMQLLDSTTQSWVDVTSQRSAYSTYRNTSSKIMIVNITLNYYVGVGNAEINYGWNISGTQFNEYSVIAGGGSYSAGLKKVLTIIVPPGAFYWLIWSPLPSSQQSNIQSWWEYK